MLRAIGMIASEGMEVGCPIGMRLWMNHIGFVFLTLGRLSAPKSQKNKANVTHPKLQPNGATDLYPMG